MPSKLAASALVSDAMSLPPSDELSAGVGSTEGSAETCGVKVADSVGVKSFVSPFSDAQAVPWMLKVSTQAAHKTPFLGFRL